MRVDIIRPDRQHLVIALQRLLVAPEPVKHRAMVRQGFRRARVELERPPNQRERFDIPALLVPNDSEQMRRIEMIGLHLQNVRVETLGFGDPALLMNRDRSSEPPRQLVVIRTAGFRWRI
jgi:hypothetical protein